MTRRAHLERANRRKKGKRRGASSILEPLSILLDGRDVGRELSQWFTPDPIARALAELAPLVVDVDAPLRCVEPSAGRGALVRALLERIPRASVDAVELDPRHAAELAAELEADTRVRVVCADYLTRPRAAERYDLAISNPPFDDGAEIAHVARILDESAAALLELPVRSLHGRERYRRIWHRCDPSPAARELGPHDWHVRAETRLVTRPRYSGARGGGADEIVLLALSREPGPCVLGWRS